MSSLLINKGWNSKGKFAWLGGKAAPCIQRKKLHWKQWIAGAIITGTIPLFLACVQKGTGMGGSALVLPEEAYRLVISAGQNRVVGIGATVLLKGSVIFSKFPIARMEWKIGNGGWEESADGIDSLRTKSDFKDTTVTCVFRVVDVQGYNAVDSLAVAYDVAITDVVSPPVQSGFSTFFAFDGLKCYAVGIDNAGNNTI
jgi:hypothetical protein